MAKTLELKIKAYKKALDSLEVALKEKKSDILRDSVIKRFEYSFELCWKTFKLFLFEQYGVDAFSSKKVFRELRRNQLVNDEETNLLLKMADDRNEIIHTYNENFSNELYEAVAINYYPLFRKITKLFVL